MARQDLVNHVVHGQHEGLISKRFEKVRIEISGVKDIVVSGGQRGERIFNILGTRFGTAKDLSGQIMQAVFATEVESPQKFFKINPERLDLISKPWMR